MNALVRLCWEFMLLVALLDNGVAIGSKVFAQSPASRSDNNDKCRYKTMINDLANRNQPPKLLDIQEDALPLFSENYDWDEQQRVRRAISALWCSLSPELWEELLKNEDDNRYSLTVMIIPETGSAKNYSVGDWCRELAYYSLINAFTQHLTPRSEPTGGPEGYPVYVEVGVESDDLVVWRKRRMSKSLYELQIELCEVAIKAMPAVIGASDDQKAAMTEKIQAEIERLNATKCPDIGEHCVAGLDLYNPELAGRIRDKVSQTQEKANKRARAN